MTEEALFAAALERPPGPEREAFLDAACAGDPARRERVGRLLAADDRPPGILDHPPDPFSTGSDRPKPALAADALFAGRFKLRQKLGEGGMGEVWVADQAEPVQRRVAVKVIRRGLASAQLLARFEAERQALALMDHPNIAKFVDAGLADGQPYFVMELIKGLPITRYCDEARLSPRERIELFAQVCRGTQHAHQKGIIHRDLKPSNILVATYDGRPVPKVIDFGVAKATGSRLTAHSIYTEVGALIGTLEYMSPEQAELNNLDIDTRTDVYALGAILYELLTGAVPFPRERLVGAGLVEMLRIIKEEDPPRPSTRLGETATAPAVAAVRRAEPRKLAALVRGELDWIVMKALAKDRNRRYESATGLAHDLERYLADEPVSAGPPSAAYRVRKFVRRHRGAVAAAVLIAVTLGLLAVGGGALAWQAERQRAEERHRRGRTAEAVAALLGSADGALRGARPDEAAVALEAAERRGADGGAEDLAERVAALRADLTLLRELNAIDTFRWMSADGRAPEPTAVAVRWRGALAAYGLTTDETPASQAAERVTTSVIRDRVLGALDQWLATDPSAWVRAVLRDADPDPYRDAVRDALAARDQGAVVGLIGRPAALGQPARFAAVLGHLYGLSAERRRAVLLSALRTRPGDLALLLLLGRSYPPGRPESTDPRVRWFQAAVAAHPANAAAHTDLGLALQQRRDREGAMASLREAVRLEPTSAITWFNLGGALLEDRDPDGAIAAFREASRLDPADPGAHANLGLALWDKNDRDGALASFQKAIDLDPNYAMGHYNLGVARRLLRDPPGAIAAFQRAADLNPDHAPTHNGLALALRSNGDLKRAITHFRKAAELRPTEVGFHLNLATALRGELELPGAVAAYRDAIRADPTQAQAHHDLAWLLATGPDGVRDGWRAVEHATRACELTDWKGSAFVDTLAAAYAAAGDFDKAVETQKKALDVAGARERLELYTRKQSYRDPAMTPRQFGPPPRVVKP